jgi:hemolysin-activating ACP:hemolysin acyltransferase
MAKKLKTKSEPAVERSDAVQSAASPAPAQRATGAAAQRRMTALGEVIAVLMRSPTHRGLSLSDVEKRFVPAIARGQFVIGKGQVASRPDERFPAALVAYAMTSAALSAKLSKPGPVDLSPEDWRSGSEVWLLESVGAPEAVAELVSELQRRLGPAVVLNRRPAVKAGT